MNWLRKGKAAEKRKTATGSRDVESSPQNDNDKLDSFLMTLEGAALSKTAPVYSEFEAYIRLVRGSYGDDDDIYRIYPVLA